MNNKSALFTDGRYELQANDEIDCNWYLVVTTNLYANIAQWLKENVDMHDKGTH